MNKQELLTLYLYGYDELAALVESASKEMLYYKPSDKKWSAVEIIVHLADADSNCSIRFRKAIAESGCNVELYDQDAWAQKLDYQHQNIVTSLALFKLTRLNNFQVLSHLDDAAWSNFIIHPERGKITLLDLLKLYVDHLDIHINQMKQNFEIYKNQTIKH